ncbi:hypothetical protein OBBRIDRAFT_764006 [Obba rivulosa]|uniref:Pentatricopeptide repeat-containing protein-mitochondrial domain-containing protein n=1 Tax=Obba rivulosa TaxID=1052685 RepID=A0A8E2ALX2_9APHY|nr:hypothetical protein OBBRIDRAFT_764006 [Obba rivulosa]
MEVCAKMRNETIRPTRTTYNLILEACASEGMLLQARATLEDMMAGGLAPDNDSFYHVLQAARYMSSSVMWEVLELMAKHEVPWDQRTYEFVILRYAEDSVELALRYLAEMGEKQLSPTLKTMEGVINAACKLHLPRLALDLAEAFEESSVRRLDTQVWVDLLIACATDLWKEGVLRTWRKVVKELNITPDEGCCLLVLTTAARHGLSSLGLDVLQILKSMHVVWEEYHIAPILEAFCRDGNVQHAFEMLSLMRANDILPTTETTQPLFELLCSIPGAIDEAWTILDELNKQGKIVDVAALNVIIQTAIAVGDLQMALGVYKAAGDLRVRPNLETFNLLLAGCIASEQRQLGDRLLTEMKEMHIKPDPRTYERLIMLCLTQVTYEDAFFYLEEMKSTGIMPPLSVYEAIVLRCIRTGDPRSQLAFEEMRECGYIPSLELQRTLNAGAGGLAQAPRSGAPQSSEGKEENGWAEDIDVEQSRARTPRPRQVVL